MLSTIRKFSTTIFAKIFLFIVAIPFIFWGMGNVFSTGNQNTIVKIGKEKISTQVFIDWIKYNAPNPDNEIIDKNSIDKLLSSFIGEQLISNEIESLGIIISDIALGKIIQNEKIFKRDDKFSKLEYAKFLLDNNLNVVNFENNMSRQIKKKQLFNFIGGGIIPSNFSVNSDYDKINQERIIEIINLNEIFKKELNFSNDQIESYFEKNKDKFIEIYKTVEFNELSSKSLSENNEYDNLFFKKIDEIDDLIAEGNNLNYIYKKFDLDNPSVVTFNIAGKDKNYKIISNFPKNLIKKVYESDPEEKTFLVESENKYFIFEIISTENIQRKISNNLVKNEILLNLAQEEKRSLLSAIINKINNDSFKKNDFNKLASDSNFVIKKTSIKNKKDDKLLKKELVEQIYSTPEKKITLIADIGLSESYLIYVDKIIHKEIKKTSDGYSEYVNISKSRIINDLYNTYDSFLRRKYEIDINYKALDRVQNFFK